MIDKKTYIYGAGGHALVVADTAAALGIEIEGFLDDFDSNPERRVLGKKVYSAAVLQCGDTVYMGFGNNAIRQKIALSLLERGIYLPKLIHPSATVAESAEIADGCYIGAGVIIDPLCKIGRFSILNNGTIVCHETVIDEAVHLCPRTVCAGKVHVGARSWLGVGSSVIEKIKISADVFIGAGSVLVKDIDESNITVYGVPAKFQKRNK